MTKLEEKIDSVIKFLQENGWTVEEQCLVFDQLRYIAQQAVEEYKKEGKVMCEEVQFIDVNYRLVAMTCEDWKNNIIQEERQRISDELPRPEECPTEEYEAAIDEVRNIISKPNI